MVNERWQSDTTHWQLADGTAVEILNIEDDHSRLDIASDARYSTGGQDVVTSFRRAFGRHGIPARGPYRQRRNLHRQTPRWRPGLPRARARRARGEAGPLPAPAPADLRQGGEVPPDPEEVAGRPTPRSHPGRPAAPAGPVPPLLQHRPPPPCDRATNPSAGLRRPPHGRARRPAAEPAQPSPPRPHRRPRRGDPALPLPATPHRAGPRTRPPPRLPADRRPSRPRHRRRNGQLLRQLVLDPTKDYQPLGRPPGPTKKP
jgi:hypothetical protein